MTDDGTADPDVAAEYLTAELEPVELSGVRSLMSVVTALVTGPGSEDPTPYDLVVRRIDSGAEIIRTRADVGDPSVLLGQVQLDLETKTVAEFVAEWRLPEDHSA
ncbi:hypothetical protein ACFSBZ_01255 [Amnibacterium flavum]|uniref:Uncharacterized protein n=1 Tax=Amnibacterium flavum TaxID=2173173 RepID=A0A2V1HQC7_9MICO|nr:hypothetical protein [Amnibacterium flavum]PVZ94813.1 hypothetical protein DDQ50_14165 [Amnibacterium flavum]